MFILVPPRNLKLCSRDSVFCNFGLGFHGFHTHTLSNMYGSKKEKDF